MHLLPQHWGAHWQARLAELMSSKSCETPCLKIRSWRGIEEDTEHQFPASTCTNTHIQTCIIYPCEQKYKPHINTHAHTLVRGGNDFKKQIQH